MAPTFEVFPRPNDLLHVLSFFLECSSTKVQSPGFPTKYPGDLRCRWLLTAKDNDTFVQFNADNINLEKCGQNCGCDYLEIFDGETALSRSLGKFCSGNARVLSSGRNMLVVFHSDKSGSSTGFSASYSNVSRNTGKYTSVYVFSVGRSLVLRDVKLATSTCLH
jgi:hypothetical protein